jgi:hypothetical protein
MSDLRGEIVEAQKLRADFVKWKLIITSGLGAAGLGFTEHSTLKYAYVVLTVIPFACAYVDLVCRHINLRIIIIGSFLKVCPGGLESAYEAFVDKTRGKVDFFVLEDWALQGSTIILSLAVTVAGLVFQFSDTKPDGISAGIKLMFIFSGLGGILLSLITDDLYKTRVEILRKLAADQDLPNELGKIVDCGAGAK